MEKLSSTLSTIRAVLEDAEEKQLKDKAIQNWLRKLKDIAYDVDDILDEFATEAMLLEPEGQSSGLINKAKIPDIEKCVDVVATLQAKKGTGEPLIADFEVSEGIYSQASIEDADSVCLWLGANVMLEYSCEEASALLQKNLENAKASLEVLLADL